jgi:hypothetical protein
MLSLQVRLDNHAWCHSYWRKIMATLWNVIQLYMQNNVKKRIRSCLHGWPRSLESCLNLLPPRTLFPFLFQFPFLLEAEGQKANTQMHKQVEQQSWSTHFEGIGGEPLRRVTFDMQLIYTCPMWIHFYQSQLFYIFTSLELWSWD